MPRFPTIFSIVLILLLSASQQSIAARRPLQQDALSNSNGCLDTIPKCERGACATRNIMGVARWVCLRWVGYTPGPGRVSEVTSKPLQAVADF